MAFRKFGGLNYSASNNIVRNNLANSDNLTISKKLGLLNSKIPVESHLDMSGNSIMNVGSIFFFADGSVQTTAYDTTGGVPGNFTTGTFSGLLSANGGFQCTDASFSGPVNVNDGIQGTDATFSGLIRANGGISGTNANFSGLLSANGGISGTNANFSGLLSANGGISGNNANFSGLISANGGISGTTGYFNNLVVAGGTAYFANIPLCLDTAVSSYTPGSLGQLTTKAYVDSKITSVSSIQVSNSTAGIYYPVLTSAIGAGQTMYGATSQLYMNTNTNLLNVSGGVTATTGYFSGLLSGNGGVTASTGFFSGVLSGSGGVTSTTGFFKNMLSADGGFTGSTGFFGGLISADGGVTATTGFFKNMLSAEGGFTGSTGFFKNMLSANGGFTGSTGFFGGLLTANGGFTGSTGFFGGLLTANGGFTGSTGFFGGLLSANGGFTGSTGFFKNLLSADGGFTGSTGFFKNMLSADGGFTGSTGFFGGLLSANGGFTGSTGFFKNLLSADGGFTGSTGFFKNMLSANGGFTGSTGFFSNTLSANGGLTASTGYFSGAITAASGITGTSAYFSQDISGASNGLFSGMVSANGGFSGSNAFISGSVTGLSTAYFGGLLSANGGITGATAYFSNTLTAAGGFTGTAGYFSGVLRAAAGITASTVYASSGTFTNIKIPTLSGSTATIDNSFNYVEGTTGDISIQSGTNGLINLWANGTHPQLRMGVTSNNLSGLSIGWNNAPDGTGGKTVLINYAQDSAVGGFNFLSASNTYGLTSIGILPRLMPPLGDSGISIPTTGWVHREISTGSSTNASTIKLTQKDDGTPCFIPFSTGIGNSQSLFIDNALGPLTYNPATSLLGVSGINAATATFSGLVTASGGFSGPTGYFSRGITAAAGYIASLSGGTASFSGLVTASGGFSGPTGYFSSGITATAGYIGNLTGGSASFSGTITAPTFSGSATNVNLTTANSGGPYYITFALLASGSNQLYTDNSPGTLTYFPATSTLGVSGINAATAIFSGEVTAASFNATSDYRIKENPVPIADTVDALRPLHYFNKLTNKEDFGFLAHEVQELFPFLVQGDKDGDGNQSLNYMGLIALLVKEVQDLKQKINNIL